MQRPESKRSPQPAVAAKPAVASAKPAAAAPNKPAAAASSKPAAHHHQSHNKIRPSVATKAAARRKSRGVTSRRKALPFLSLDQWVTLSWAILGLAVILHVSAMSTRIVVGPPAAKGSHERVMHWSDGGSLSVVSGAPGSNHGPNVKWNTVGHRVRPKAPAGSKMVIAVSNACSHVKQANMCLTSYDLLGSMGSQVIGTSVGLQKCSKAQSVQQTWAFKGGRLMQGNRCLDETVGRGFTLSACRKGATDQMFERRGK